MFRPMRNVSFFLFFSATCNCRRDDHSAGRFWITQQRRIRGKPGKPRLDIDSGFGGTHVTRLLFFLVESVYYSLYYVRVTDFRWVNAPRMITFVESTPSLYYMAHITDAFGGWSPRGVPARE